MGENEERARLQHRAEGKRGQKHDMQDVLEPQAKTKARLEPTRGQKFVCTPLLPDLWEEVTSTVSVVSGSAPIQGGSSSSTNVPVNYSVAASVRVEDMVRTSIPVSSDVGIQPAISGTVEKLTDRVLTWNVFPGSSSRNRCKVS